MLATGYDPKRSRHYTELQARESHRAVCDEFTLRHKDDTREEYTSTSESAESA